MNSLASLWQLATITYFTFQVIGKPPYHSKEPPPPGRTGEGGG